MDHVGGIAKSTIKRETAAGEFLIEVKEMVEFLQSKFSPSVQPIYIIKGLEEKNLLEKKELSRLKVFKTVDGSSLFQVISFTPNPQTLIFVTLAGKIMEVAHYSNRMIYRYLSQSKLVFI